MKFIVHTDGGARGNPGPAAIGVVIEEVDASKTQVLARFGKRIGNATNNVAEYTAVIAALNAVIAALSAGKQEVGESPDIEFFLDSTLVVNQLNGLFKIKDPTLRQLNTAIRILEQEVGGVTHYTAVPREQNRRADFLVNQALDT
ncbi:MAG: ribonuclease HI family protein [Candidatus Gottesmanbacteria bacterium]|nr:ribonuclease HI family protein [Candidatus Gottesmanbacteria bacterium]